MPEKKKTIKTMVPPAVFKNLLSLNFLVILILLFSTLGLYCFLHPKAFPVTITTDEYGKIKNKKLGVLAFWEMDINVARRLIYLGIPILKRIKTPNL